MTSFELSSPNRNVLQALARLSQQTWRLPCLLLTGLLLLTATYCVSALAQGAGGNETVANYPNQAVKIIIPFPPGGATDVIARIIGQKLTEQMGQPFIVENKAGANGNIAHDYVAKAAPDGYTILYNTSSIAVGAALYKKLPYNVRSDFAPIALTSVVPMLLAVNPKVPANNLQELIELIRKNPDSMSYGSAGMGNITHLSPFMMLQHLSLVATHVPYKGSAPSVIGLVGGEIQFNMEPLTVGLPFVKDQRIRPIAVSTMERSPVLPNVPTLNESGMPGFEVGAWQGILAPAKTPSAIIERLNKEVMKALASPDAAEKLQAQGAQILKSTPQEYAAYLDKELERWEKVVKSSGVQPE
jgi:tripartite-type tricarboxylate transporter receptor subunit TctC